MYPHSTAEQFCWDGIDLLCTTFCWSMNVEATHILQKPKHSWGFSWYNNVIMMSRSKGPIPVEHNKPVFVVNKKVNILWYLCANIGFNITTSFNQKWEKNQFSRPVQMFGTTLSVKASQN